MAEGGGIPPMRAARGCTKSAAQYEYVRSPSAHKINNLEGYANE